MIVFTRKYPLQRMLKKRSFKKNRKPSLRYGTIGLYCLYTFRFEYRYCLFFRKFFKRLFRRRKRKVRTQYRRKTWLFIRPNYTLTHKSKNARMGKGKGNFKRWCTIVYPGRVFIEHSNVSPFLYNKYMKKMSNKMKLEFKVIQRARATLKKRNINNSITPAASLLDLVRVRNRIAFTEKQYKTFISSPVYYECNKKVISRICI